MLAAYYERGEDADLLFRSLKISKAESYRAHLNQYDVIKVNIQEFPQHDREVWMRCFRC